VTRFPIPAPRRDVREVEEARRIVELFGVLGKDRFGESLAAVRDNLMRASFAL
jgi:hypothetical protein